MINRWGVVTDGWRLALGTLTAVPVRPPAEVDRRRATVAMLIAPLASLPLGLGLAAVIWLGHWAGLSPLVTALLGLGVIVAGNRCFHLDGLSDVADALAASYDQERSLQVMKSGSSGPAGVAATVLVLGTQAAALASVQAAVSGWRAAVLACLSVCLSRVALVITCARGVRAARGDGIGNLFTQTIPKPVALGVLMVATLALTACVWWVGLAWWRGPLAVVLMVVVVVLLLRRCLRRFGGVTGDVFGASIEVSLATVLVCLAWGLA